MIKVNQSKESKRKCVQDSEAMIFKELGCQKNEMIHPPDCKLLEGWHHILFNTVSQGAACSMSHTEDG